MLTPLNNRVLVKPDKRKDRTKSGILLIDKDEKPIMGTVIKSATPLVKNGERVIFSKFGYDEVEVEDEKFYIVSEHNLLAILCN